MPGHKHGARDSDIQCCGSSRCNTILHRTKPQCNRDTGKVVCNVWRTHALWSIYCTQLFVYHRHTTVSNSVKSYYASNFHSTVRLNCMLHICVLVSRDVLYCSTWNFYGISSYSKLSSPINLISFRSFHRRYILLLIWTDNGITLPEANTQRQGGKYLMIKVFWVAFLSYYYIQSIQCSSFTGQAICNLPYYYHSSPLPSYHHMGFNLPPTDALLYQSIRSM